MTKPDLKYSKPSEPKQEDHLAFYGENHSEALLLGAIVAACSMGDSKTISSNSVRAYARAIQELTVHGLVAVLTEEAEHITARITAKGEAYLKQLLIDDDEERAERDL